MICFDSFNDFLYSEVFGILDYILDYKFLFYVDMVCYLYNVYKYLYNYVYIVYLYIFL